VNWTSSLSSLARAAVAEVLQRVASHDGIVPLSGHLVEALGDGHDEYLIAWRGGSPIGMAAIHQGDPVELFVAPEHRRQGLGSELLRSALERAGAVWAHGDLPAAQGLARTFDLVRSRELLQLRRSLTPVWASAQVLNAPLPAGVRIRTFVPGQDEQPFLDVNARAFDWHPEQGRLDLAGLLGELAQPWFDPAGFLLAVDDNDRLLGFHWTKIHRDGLVPLGEIYVLAVDPAGLLGGRSVRGLGAPLTALGLEYLAGRGLEQVLLYVEGNNHKALTLYQNVGFETFLTDVVYRRSPAVH